MKRLSIIFLLVPMVLSCHRGMTWEKLPVDGHRTGVTAPKADNVRKALGVVDTENNVYLAPNGVTFTEGCIAQVAARLIEAQADMAEVKEVIAYSTAAMKAQAPESALSDFIVDFVREETGRLTGQHCDVAITNFGGIRVDMPEGDVILDDIRSMFPFNNKLCYVQLPGSELLRLMDDVAQYGPQCLSGVKLVISDHKVKSLEVGGKPVDPKKKYGVATIDFLLDGGDNLNVGRGATRLINTGVIIGTAIEQYVRRLTAEGKAIEYQTDGRVTVEQ